MCVILLLISSLWASIYVARVGAVFDLADHVRKFVENRINQKYKIEWWDMYGINDFFKKNKQYGIFVTTASTRTMQFGKRETGPQKPKSIYSKKCEIISRTASLPI
uniref:Putative secreted protein n=1 Tax=Ixodes ricinus TaxID=34613 RepID=A0A0K8RCQ1_IXORI